MDEINIYNMEQEPVLNAHNKEEYPPMHTAEHILNQTMVRMFGCPRSRNAHIERKKSKCDYILDTCPSDEQVAEIERRVNEVIAQGLPVTYEFVARRSATRSGLGKTPRRRQRDAAPRPHRRLRPLRLRRHPRAEHLRNRPLPHSLPRLQPRYSHLETPL